MIERFPEERFTFVISVNVGMIKGGFSHIAHLVDQS
jgi:hypothetical protein